MRPLDDDKLLQNAMPVRPDGMLKADTDPLVERHNFQVKAALGTGPVSVIALGESHDLSESVRKLGAGTTTYLWIATKTLRRVCGH